MKKELSEEAKLIEIEAVLALNLLPTPSRYFQEGDGIQCNFCRKTGHKFRECTEKETRCHLCRADHDPTRCPLADVCFQCYRRGHQKQYCPDRGIQKYCEYCEQSGHSTMDCARVWRQYVLIKNPTRISSFTVSCYHCASSDHFGDFCDYRPRGFTPDTAFSVTSREIDDIKRDIGRGKKSKLYDRIGSKASPPSGRSNSSGRKSDNFNDKVRKRSSLGGQKVSTPISTSTARYPRSMSEKSERYQPKYKGGY